MENSDLFNLNFKKLLHYREPYDHASKKRAICEGYCVSCDVNGYLNETDDRLDLMSHGADFNDFENALGPLNEGGLPISTVFLLESPGGDYKNGEVLEYRGFKKQPPTRCHYWVPSGLKNWPKTDEFINPKSYGLYFAYLMRKHRFRNAYITNAVKCGIKDTRSKKHFSITVQKKNRSNHSRIWDDCVRNFLEREMELVNPDIVFCFGIKAWDIARYSGLMKKLANTDFVKLLHPAARKNYREKCRVNNKIIEGAIERFR